MKEKLVSLIVPCYNGEKYLGRFFDSVLEQTYTYIQLIFVDDGSIDNTEQIVNEYKPKLKSILADAIFLTQNNAGAAAAVNNALKYVEGEYLTWADSDDLLMPNNIKSKIDYLETHPEKGMVLGRAIAVDEETGEGISLLEYKTKNSKQNLFEDLIISGIPCYPGVFMERTNLLFKRWTSREIPFNREVGQNWQLLLPVAYDNECGYIDDYIYLYKVRRDSHSRQAESDYHRQFRRLEIQECMLNKILVFIDSDDRRILDIKIKRKYIVQKLDIAFKLRDKLLIKKCLCDAKNMNISISIKKKVKCLFILIPGVNKIVKLLNK